MKTIGILGGISSQATMDLELRLHQVSQRLIPQHGNSGYPPLLVYYHRRPPVLTIDGITPVLPIQPDPDLIQAARWLGSKADFLIIAANGTHLLQSQIEQAAGRKVLSMIEATRDEVQWRNWKRVGVLGFPMASVPIYTAPLGQMGLTCETIDDSLQERLVADIIALMEGRIFGNAAEEAVESLRKKNVDGIILGCTEIPLLLGEKANQPDLINPVALLAEAAIEFAMSEEAVLR